MISRVRAHACNILMEKKAPTHVLVVIYQRVSTSYVDAVMASFVLDITPPFVMMQRHLKLPHLMSRNTLLRPPIMSLKRSTEDYRKTQRGGSSCLKLRLLNKQSTEYFSYTLPFLLQRCCLRPVICCFRFLPAPLPFSERFTIYKSNLTQTVSLNTQKTRITT